MDQKQIDTMNRRIAATREAAEKQAKCPTCGAIRERLGRMERFEDEIVRWLRETNAAASDSCILCVEKHVSRALVLWEELLSAAGSGAKDGSAAVNVYRNHIKIIGHLGNAYDESADFPELHELLKAAERNYRYEGIAPDWPALLAAMEAVKQKNVG
jgi:hypothetical protein